MKTPKNNQFVFVLSLLAAFALTGSIRVACAKTFAEQTLRQKNELTLPERITVGPSDNFQTAVSPDGKSIFFSSSSQLAVHVSHQEFESNFSRSFIDEKNDSKDPALSPDGSTLAYTGYFYDARGDICLYSLSDKTSRCLTEKDTEDRSPFWIDRHHIGYLTRKTIEEPYSVAVISTDGKASPQILFSGAVADPVCSPAINGEHWIAYTEMKNDRTVIEVRKLIESSSRLQVAAPIGFTVDLPGFSSFPAFDPKGEYLYFGQYTIDTNGDSKVDARDKSAIFRVRLSDVLAGHEIFPEPLSSIDYNCNYPVPSEFGLYMTCASPNLTGDGSLDIYQLPLTGMIPPDWDEKKLLRGIETSRSYNDRILLYYSLISRFPNYRRADTLEKVMSNYITDGQYSAAIFYANKLESSMADPDYYKALNLLMESDLRFAQEGEGIVSSAFRAFIQGQIRKLKSLKPKQAYWDRVVHSSLLRLEGQTAGARQLIAGLSMDSFKAPLSLYFYSKLLDSLDKSGKLSRLQKLADSKPESEAARVYYAYEFVRLSDQVYPGLAQRLSFLKRTQAQISDKKSPLYQMIDEDLVLAKFKSDDTAKPENQKVYGELLDRINQLGSRYFLHRAMLVRAILDFSKRGFWNYMYFFANDWLTYSTPGDIEYSYARKQFLSIGLETAYGYWGKGQYNFAGDQFMLTARLTDDLEAHYGFIRARLKEHRDRELHDTYKRLKAQGFIKENLVYVSALFSIIDFQLKHPSEVVDTKLFESLLHQLEGMPANGYNPALRFSLMGYLCHRLYQSALLTGNEDPRSFEKAHRYYMLALDLSRENERVVSNLLFDLARLHQIAGNHGQSLAFFELRKRNVFEDEQEKAAFAWFYAKSFFDNLQPEKALAVISDFLKVSGHEKKYPEFLEKAGFYAAQSQGFAKANSYYQSFFKTNPRLGDIDALRVKMGYAFSLFKAKNFREATALFQQILNTKSLSASTNREPGHSLPLDQYHLLALGYLAQMENDESKRAALLLRRLQIYEKQSSDLNRIFMKREDWLRTVITIDNQIALAEIRAGDEEKALPQLSRTLNWLSELSNQTGNVLDRTYVKGIANYFAAVLAKRSKTPGFTPKELKQAIELAQSTHSALARVPELRQSSDYASFERMYSRIVSGGKS